MSASKPPNGRAEQRRQQGQRVAEARVEARLSKAELGRQLGYKAPHMYWRLEAGQRGYTTEQLLQVAQITGVRFEWLATGNGPKPAQQLDPTIAQILEKLEPALVALQGWLAARDEQPRSVRERVAVSLSRAAAEPGPERASVAQQWISEGSGA